MTLLLAHWRSPKVIGKQVLQRDVRSEIAIIHDCCDIVKDEVAWQRIPVDDRTNQKEARVHQPPSPVEDRWLFPVSDTLIVGSVPRGCRWTLTLCRWISSMVPLVVYVIVVLVMMVRMMALWRGRRGRFPSWEGMAFEAVMPHGLWMEMSPCSAMSRRWTCLLWLETLAAESRLNPKVSVVFSLVTNVRSLVERGNIRRGLLLLHATTVCRWLRDPKESFVCTYVETRGRAWVLHRQRPKATTAAEAANAKTIGNCCSSEPQWPYTAAFSTAHLVVVVEVTYQRKGRIDDPLQIYKTIYSNSQW